MFKKSHILSTIPLLNSFFVYVVNPDDIKASISAEGEPTPGQTYILNCTVSLPEGIASPPALQWSDSSGPLVSGEGITVGSQYTLGAISSLILQFDPLRVAHGGLFICEAVVLVAAPPYNLTEFAEFDVIVPGMCMYVIL